MREVTGVPLAGNPLECFVCNEELSRPVRLGCGHVFCRGCVRVGSSGCPRCGVPAGDSPPQTDQLAQFLVDISHEAAEVCANCDQMRQPMFYCETCQQALCSQCKGNTHQARMFSTHRVVLLEERACVRGAISCSLHSQPFVLFCIDTKQLACIECFNQRPQDAEYSFVSLEQARRSHEEKLEKWAARLQTKQERNREEAASRHELVTHINNHFQSAHDRVFQVCQEVMDTVVSVRDSLVRSMEEERKERTKLAQLQIEAIHHSLARTSFNLLATHVLCSSASLIDFLHLSAELTRRIQSDVEWSVEKAPAATAFEVSAKEELARALESVLGILPSQRATAHSSRRSANRRSSSPLGMLSKYQLMVDLSGAFGGLFARVEGPVNEMAVEVAELAVELQEVQRDLTLRKCLVPSQHIQRIIQRCREAEERLEAAASIQEEIQPEMVLLWQEELDRVSRQQTLVRNTMFECSSLRSTAELALSVAQQLAPFATSIQRISMLVQPKRCGPPVMAPMESLCLQICTIEPDSESRVQAIAKKELERAASAAAKKLEEAAGAASLVTSLKTQRRRRYPGSGRRSKMVDERRERSPGGTDVTLLSPFLRPSTVQSTSGTSDVECSVEDELQWMGSSEESERHSSIASADGCWRGEARERTSLSLSLCPGQTLPSPPAPSRKLGENEEGLARMRGRSLLESLNELFIQERPVDQENALKASSVKETERRISERKLTEASSSNPSSPSVSMDSPRLHGSASLSSPPPDPPQPSPPPVLLSLRSGTQPPAVPFVPAEILRSDPSSFSSPLGAFEARERVLESLKQKHRESKLASSDHSDDESAVSTCRL